MAEPTNNKKQLDFVDYAHYHNMKLTGWTVFFVMVLISVIGVISFLLLLGSNNFVMDNTYTVLLIVSCIIFMASFLALPFGIVGSIKLVGVPMPEAYKKKLDSKGGLKNLLKYLAPYKGKILFGICLSVLAVSLRVAAPLMIKKISELILAGIESVPYTIDFGTISIYGFITIGLYVLAFGCDYLQAFMMSGLAADIGKKLRTAMVQKINSLPLSYFDARNIGDILSIVTNDIDTIGNVLNQTLSTLISSSLTLIGTIGIMFFLDWRIALIALIALPLELLVLMMVAGKSQKFFLNQQNEISEVSSLAEENYTAFNIVRVFRDNKRSIEKFDETNQKLCESSKKSQFYSGLSNPLMNMIGNICFACICLFGGYFAAVYKQSSGGDITYIATIVTCITYSDQLLQPLTQLAQIAATFQQAIASSKRVFEFLGETDQEDESMKTLKLEKVEGNIEFSHVKFGYDKTRVIIHDFNEKAMAGQKVAIVGPTGAGKTTMVNLLMRFYDIDDGNILIEGESTSDMNRSYVRSLFGMVLQDTWLFEGTFMDNLKFSRRDATDEEVYAACAATHCDSFIRTQPGGYNGVLSGDSGLSSGQKQLITIARAMIQNAPMLILDEATSSVDTRTELLIQDAMDKLMNGRTSFVIAHRLSTIKNADLILVMKDGDVIESGNHETLMAKPNGFYHDLYNSQFSQNMKE